MNLPATTWTTDDQCPSCGTSLTLTGDSTSPVQQDCPACGWSVTWAPDPGSGADG